MASDFQSPLVNDLADFLHRIGLSIEAARLDEPTFLPGVTVLAGIIRVDESRLLHPGDLLHEAGHLAVLPPHERLHANAPLETDPGLEMAAIIWSWAALQELKLAPEIVFHEQGYKGAAHSLIENFTAGRYIAVGLLQWMGMTTEAQFPAMIHWLRPADYNGSDA